MHDIDRRSFLRQLAIASAATSVPAVLGASRSATDAHQPRRRPNIVFIMADDLGYGDLGITGRTDYRTPFIDGIARDGVQLMQSYCAAPVCSPTRVALLTGRYPAREAAGLIEPLTTQLDGLPAEPHTLPRLMKDAGYDTALIGKWHLGLGPAYHPLRHGFDEFYGFLGAAADYTSHRDTETHDNQFFDGTTPVTESGYLTDMFTERAVRYVSRAHAKPFFLSLQYNAPHWPWQAPGDPAYPDTLGASLGGSPETFGRMVESMDRGVGRVLSALAERGLERDTLLVFTSDNGGERFSHMGPYSEKKMTLGEGGIHVMTMARWPGVIAAGTKTHQVSVTMDWTATMLALADATSPRSLDGIDLMPFLRGRRATVDRTIAWRIAQRRSEGALRQGAWKYLRNERGEFLFDLQSDPGERTDRRASNGARFDALASAFRKWEAEMQRPVPLDPARR